MREHLIADISFKKDWLLCLCGWEGKAYDKSFYLHRKQIALELDIKLNR